MAAEYPYVLTPDAFRDFVTKLKTVGVPDKVNKQFIASLGFKSSNHQKFPGVLKFVGLVDSAGKPTQEYRAALRDPKSGPGALAGYIREAYSGLFDVYTDAHRKDDEALRNFFAARTDLGDRAVKPWLIRSRCCAASPTLRVLKLAPRSMGQNRRFLRLPAGPLLQRWLQLLSM